MYSNRRNYSKQSRHYMWKGDEVGYAAAHHRVKMERGKAVLCIFGCVARRYEWANLTGRYADPYDYAPMCGTCHNRFDVARKSMEFRIHYKWRMAAADKDQKEWLGQQLNPKRRMVLVMLLPLAVTLRRIICVNKFPAATSAARTGSGGCR